MFIFFKNLIFKDLKNDYEFRNEVRSLKKTIYIIQIWQYGSVSAGYTFVFGKFKFYKT